MQHNVQNLWDSLLLTVEIFCTVRGCRQTQEIHNTDEYQAGEVFFKDGWRGTPNHTYCPKCAKKHLKNGGK